MMKTYACFALLLFALDTAAADGTNPETQASPTTATTKQSTTLQPSTTISSTSAPENTTKNSTGSVTSQPMTNHGTASSNPSTISAQMPTTTVASTVTIHSTSVKSATTASPMGSSTAAPTANNNSTVPTNETTATESNPDSSTAPTTNVTDATITSNTTQSPTISTQPTATITSQNNSNTSPAITTNTSPNTNTSQPIITTNTSLNSTTTLSTTTSPQPTTSSVTISETNLLLATDNFFVELQGDKNVDLVNLTLVIKNGSSGDNVFEFHFNDSDTLNSTGLFVQPVDKTAVQKLSAVAVVLYKPNANTTMYEDMQDYVVYANNADPSNLNKELSEALLKGGHVRVVGTSKTGNLTMTRFVNTPKDNAAFVLASNTQGVLKTAVLTLLPVNLTFQLRPTSKDLCQIENQNNKTLDEVLGQLASTVPACGLSTQQIVGDLRCQRDLFFTFKIKQSYVGQGDAFLSGYNQYVRGEKSVTIGGKTYKVINCTRQCLPAGHHQPPANGKNGNIRVTVAVVLSCIVVFLLILISVIFYMRRKRRGIMRQFRMTRLQEDDDMDDMDDFMGAIDQEPSFSSSRNNLTN